MKRKVETDEKEAQMRLMKTRLFSILASSIPMRSWMFLPLTILVRMSFVLPSGSKPKFTTRTYPKQGDTERFQLIRRAVEELASLGMVGEWKSKVAEPINRKERGQTVSEDYWELRGRDFFAELETELTDELENEVQ